MSRDYEREYFCQECKCFHEEDCRCDFERTLEMKFGYDIAVALEGRMRELIEEMRP